MRRFSPVQIGLAVAILVIIVLAVLLARARGGDEPEATQTTAQKSPREQQQERCGSQRTYDRIKLELFRVAAQTRGGDRTMFDRLSAYSSVRVERPTMSGFDEDLGTLRCAGRLSLDLPPGTAVVGGRRTLSADVDYVLQPAADGSGDVVLLEGADPIVIPLATVARTGETAPPPQLPPVASAPPGAAAPPAEAPPLPPVAAPAPSAPPTPRTAAPAQASTRPSFNCRYARTSGERAVCSDGQLAALDRSMASQFYRALSAADRGQRRQLTVTRDRFLRYRDRCGSNACIADAYQGRMREIDDIMRR